MARKVAEETTPSQPKKRKDQHFGVISDHESYTVDEFRKRLGIGYKLWREMRAQGLKVRVAGERRLFVLGSDWHEYLRSK